MAHSPTFRELLNGLGFGEVHQPLSLLFIHDVTYFLKSHGTLVSPRYNELASSFLSVHERGFLYWPPIPSPLHLSYMDFDEQRRINQQVAYLFRRIHEVYSKHKNFTSPKGMPLDAKKRTLPASYILDQMAQSGSLGFISFTYGIVEARGAAMFHSPWFPRQGFNAETFGELASEIPGAAHARGFEMTFTGPNCQIKGHVVNDNDLNRLKAELNRQLDCIVLERAGDILKGTINLHLQIYILQEPTEQNAWIF